LEVTACSHIRYCYPTRSNNELGRLLDVQLMVTKAATAQHKAILLADDEAILAAIMNAIIEELI